MRCPRSCDLAIALSLGALSTTAAAQATHAGNANPALPLGLAQVYFDAFVARIEAAWPVVLNPRLIRATVAPALGPSLAGAAFAPVGGAAWPVGAPSDTPGPEAAWTTPFDVPSTMSYLSLGWGHSVARGLALRTDLALRVGTGKASAALASTLRARTTESGPDSQAELAQQLQTLADGALKFSVVPVLSLGLSYRW